MRDDSPERTNYELKGKNKAGYTVEVYLSGHSQALGTEK